MADKTLPNGQVIRGVPDNISDADLKEYAIMTGAATEADYNRDRQTKADYLSTVGELGGGVAGAMIGASIGSAVPIVGTAIGGLVGGAIGTAAGYFGGEAIESFVEDRDFDVEQATDESIRAGMTDAAFSGAFGVLGKGFKTIYQPARALFQPKYFATPRDAGAAETAMAIQRGETTLEEVIQKGNYGEEYIKEITEQLGKRGDELATTAELQGKLTAMGGTMLPAQAAKEYGTYAQDYASSSYFMKGIYDDILAKQDNYITKQFKEILGKTTDDKTRQETGEALSALVRDSERALQVVVDPIYKAIDKEGAINLATGRIKNNAARTFGTIRNPSSTARTIMNTINKIDASLTPAQVYKEMRALRQLSKNIAPNDAGSRKLLKSAQNNLKATLKGKRFVHPNSTIAKGKEALDTIITKEGTTGILGTHKKIANKLANMRENMSFSEAHVELSELKALQRDMVASVGTKNSKAEKLIGDAIGEMEKAMDTASKNFNPALKKKYDDVKELYKDGINTINGDWIVKSLKKDNIADVGQYLVKAGESLGVQDVKKLLAKAKELGVDTKGNNILESIEKEFINNLFPTGSAQSGLKFMDKMQSAKFADTFNAIVGKEKAEKLKTLGEEIQILSRGVEGSETALSLSIRSGEIGVVRDPFTIKSIAYPILGAVARGQLKGKAITKKVNALKAANAQMRAGKPIAKGTMDAIMEGLPTAAAYTGGVIGKVAVDQDQG